MKKVLGFFVLFTSLAAFQFTQAQDVSINITNFPSVPLGGSVPILVTVCNEDPNPITAVANKLRPQLSVSPNVTITGVTNTDGSPLTDFTILSLDGGNGNNVTVLLTVPLPNGECKSFNVNVTGTVISGNTLFNSSLGFQGPQTPGNITGNDNSPSGIAVTPALPVTLVSFTAAKENSTVSLNWATTAETNSDRFEIEHSLTGKDWGKIGTVVSNGESTSLKSYKFNDIKPSNGENLYRLKMIDRDATYAYSRIQSVKFEGQTGPAVTVYPNPSVDKVFIQDAEFAEIKQVSIMDMNGRALFSSNTVSSNGINVSKFNAGTYILHIKNINGSVSNHKIVIAK